jgi:hypothetical protein
MFAFVQDEPLLVAASLLFAGGFSSLLHVGIEVVESGVWFEAVVVLARESLEESLLRLCVYMCTGYGQLSICMICISMSASAYMIVFCIPFSWLLLFKLEYRPNKLDQACEIRYATKSIQRTGKLLHKDKPALHDCNLRGSGNTGSERTCLHEQ